MVLWPAFRPVGEGGEGRRSRRICKERLMVRLGEAGWVIWDAIHLNGESEACSRGVGISLKIGDQAG